ncbi:MAG: nucleotidyl transferase AbiEii/AbiGii toxin family protein [Planctomycetota bacterium]
MHEKVLPEHSDRLLEALDALGSPLLDGWTLAGGTGLALQLGHRVSEDFDFFRTDHMDVRQLHEVVSSLGEYETLQEAEHTLTIITYQTKLSFFRIPDPFLFDRKDYRFFQVASVDDIALMKLVAIAGRGSRKDFIDLYRILRTGENLQEYFDLLPEKYSNQRLNTYHILKSLTFFEDAEQEPMPEMLQPFDWEECKKFFVREAHALVLR